MLWNTTPFELTDVRKDAQGNSVHLLLLMSDERIYEAEYLPNTEEFYIFSRQEAIPANSERVEHWTYAQDIWTFHSRED